MTRFKRLKDWPERLSTMTVEQLRREASYWRNKGVFLGHATARREAMKRAAQVEAVLERRLASDQDVT